MTTYSVTDRELLVLNARDIPEGEIGDMLLASAYFPAFRNDKLGGKRYLDGGGWNNVPINILLEHDYKDILVIRIYGLGYDSERTTEIPEELSGYRVYTELVFPYLAERMKLKKNWTYKELYLSFLEENARKFRISRFHIYTPAELKQKINEKYLLHIYS